MPGEDQAHQERHPHQREEVGGHGVYRSACGERSARCSRPSRCSVSVPLTAPTAGRERTALAPASWATRSASFWSLHGSTMIDLDLLRLHELDQLARDGSGVGGNAGSLLDGARLDETEAGEEVGPHGVIDDDLGALERLEQSSSTASWPRSSRARNSVPVPLEGGAVLRGDAHEPVEDIGGDGRAPCRDRACSADCPPGARRPSTGPRGSSGPRGRGCPARRRRGRGRPG